jgi:hypothetical protein
VPARRLAGWVERFAQQHGEPAGTVTPGGLLLVAPDGQRADLTTVLPGWTPPGADGDSPGTVTALVAELARQVLAEPVVAVLLLRRGGYAAAVLSGDRVLASKVGTRYVQGRTAAGGWSQHRFARRRENQTDDLIRTAVETAVRVVLPAGARLLAAGGDRALVDRALADPRLRSLAALPRTAHLAVGDPRADVVRAVPAMLSSLRVELTG